MGPIFTFIYISINLVAQRPAGLPRESMSYALVPKRRVIVLEGTSSWKEEQNRGEGYVFRVPAPAEGF